MYRVIDCPKPLVREVDVLAPNELLDPEEIALVAACLLAAEEGPFFPDWEFQTLFGIERSDLRKVRLSWPNVSLDDQAVYLSVVNSLAHLLGYPYSQENEFRRYVPQGRSKILEVSNKLMERWPGETRFR